MSGSFDFVMTEADYVAYNARVCGIKYARSGAIGLSIVLVIALLVGERDPFLFITPIIVVIIYVTIMFLWMLQRVKAMYRDTPSMRELQSVDFTSEVFSVSASNGTFKVPWGDFYRWDMNDRSLALWINAAMFLLIPRRSLSDENSDLMMTYLEKAGLRRNKRRTRA